MMSWSTRYQYFTNVSYRTCSACLRWHGRIAWRKKRFPDRGDGCERVILPIPRRARREARERAREMGRSAQGELLRRQLMARAEATLAEDVEEAEALFARAASIDVYVPELEQLAQRLPQDPELAERLRRLFRTAYSDKFGRRRYERLPERMRLQREAYGMERIDALFGKP